MSIPVKQIAMSHAVAHVISGNRQATTFDQGFVLHGKERKSSSVRDDPYPDPVAIRIERVEADKVRLIPHSPPLRRDACTIANSATSVNAGRLSACL
jgi:hypothetical protein